MAMLSWSALHLPNIQIFCVIVQLCNMLSEHSSKIISRNPSSKKLLLNQRYFSHFISLCSDSETTSQLYSWCTVDPRKACTASVILLVLNQIMIKHSISTATVSDVSILDVKVLSSWVDLVNIWTFEWHLNWHYHYQLTLWHFAQKTRVSRVNELRLKTKQLIRSPWESFLLSFFLD